MADIPYIQQAQEVKITGQDAVGDTVNYVTADANGNLAVKDYSDGPVTPGAAASVSSLIGGQFNTVLPILTNTQQSALQVDSSGRAIVAQGTTPWSVAHLDTAPATQSITAFDTATTTFVGANGQNFYTGAPTAGSAAVFNISSIGTVTVEGTLLGAGGTMVVEASMDGGTFWIRPNVYQQSTQSYTNSFTAPFICVLDTAGMTQLRVRGTVSWTGTATIRVIETINQRCVTVLDALPPGSNTIGSIVNVSGTVSLPTGASTSANQTTEITSLQLIDNAIGSVAAGTAGTNSFLAGAVFNTALPTLTNGQQVAVQVDSSGRLIIAPGLTVSTKIALTPASPASVSVGVATTAAVAVNANRKGLILTNTSNNKIFLGLGVSAVLNEGIALFPGGSWVMDDYSYTTVAVNAIATAAASNLAIQEFS